MPTLRAIHSFVEREVVGCVLAVSVLSLYVLPSNAAALTSLLALLLACAAVPAFRYRRHAPLRAIMAERPVVALALAVALALLGTAGAVNPWVSFTGLLGQHSGSLLWTALGVLFVALIVWSRAGDAGRVARAVALAGTALSLGALADAAGVWSLARFSPEPSGVLESSHSLGQVAVVALGAAVAWGFARSGTERAVAVACAVACGAALIVSDARAAWLGAGVALVLALATTRWIAKGGRRVPVATIALVAAVLLASGVGWYIVQDAEDTAMDAALRSISSDRTVVWSSALARVSSSPALGAGAEQFSAWVTWDSEPGVSLTKTGTYDPHNVVWWWLLAAGWPGVVAAVLALGSVTQHLSAALAASGGSPVAAAVLAGVLGWGVTLTLGWVSPLSAFMAVALSASTIAAVRRRKADVPRPESRRPGALAAVVPVVFAIAAIAVQGPGIVAEYRWAQAVDRGSVTRAVAMDAARGSRDPSLHALAVSATVQDAARDPSRAAELLREAEQFAPSLQRDSVWHVDAAFERFQLAVARVGLLGDADAWADAEAAIEAGKRADPASGLWDYVAAAQAAQFGFDEEAAVHAAAALEYDVPSGVRPFLTGLLGE